MRHIYLYVSLIGFFLLNEKVSAQVNNDQLIAYWSFDIIGNDRTEDKASGLNDIIKGHYKVVDGVVGKALKCDGFTTSIMRDGEDAPVITTTFAFDSMISILIATYWLRFDGRIH